MCDFLCVMNVHGTPSLASKVFHTKGKKSKAIETRTEWGKCKKVLVGGGSRCLVWEYEWIVHLDR